MKIITNTCIFALLALSIACSPSTAKNEKSSSTPHPQQQNQNPTSTAQSEPSTTYDKQDKLPQGICDKNEKSFSAFLNEYVNKRDIREQFMAHEIEIRSFSDPTKKIGVETSAQNRPFKIGLVNHMWSYMEAEKDKSSEPHSLIKIDKKLHGESMRVDFVKAEFTPDHDLIRTYGPMGAYIFEHKQGCWQLTQELR